MVKRKLNKLIDSMPRNPIIKDPLKELGGASYVNVNVMNPTKCYQAIKELYESGDVMGSDKDIEELVTRAVWMIIGGTLGQNTYVRKSKAGDAEIPFDDPSRRFGNMVKVREKYGINKRFLEGDDYGTVMT